MMTYAEKHLQGLLWNVTQISSDDQADEVHKLKDLGHLILRSHDLLLIIDLRVRPKYIYELFF